MAFNRTGGIQHLLFDTEIFLKKNDHHLYQEIEACIKNSPEKDLTDSDPDIEV